MSAPQTPVLDAQALEHLVGQVLDEARRAGATAAEVAVSHDTGLSVNVRLGEVETLEFHRDQGVGVTVYIGRRKGSASSSDLRAQSLREVAEAACRIARYTAEDPFAGLADAQLMARDYPALDLDHPWDLEADAAIEIARRCEAAARAEDARIVNSEGGSVNTFRGTAVYGNTHGFVGGYAATRHSLSCSVLAGDGGSMERDYWYTVAREAGGLDTPESVGIEAAHRAVRRLNARRLSTRRYPVLYAPDVARSMLGHFVAAIRGSALYRKSSFLVDRLGEQIFPEFVHIHEQPHIPRALGSAPFDSEGVATRARDLVRDGRLESYALDSYSARKLGMQTTGNAGGLRNLTIDPGTQDAQALLREMGTGLLVTELIGHGINMVNGDYSRGAAGFWVENGEILYPVSEITVAGNLKDMFMNLVAVGADVDQRANIRTGSLLIDGLTIAGD
ncbi:metalloprotease PmbA [Ectothiorhodospira lacustris]|uniref:metalloprotease PmbA n=1 Tax=Ectothiorhodospira lacustris TaxID=2899127 RepID=UPI001EE96784|nr:metalloprotease PmbA [Ectothiorhodospira lacustris]MCG5508946.1 metalloprotease PmbA [Ectothiorhodospira lacustris]MCG5520737.1 metalloprotease PmbA [Ectothiorhodospira lacustris]